MAIGPWEKIRKSHKGISKSKKGATTIRDNFMPNNMEKSIDAFLDKARAREFTICKSFSIPLINNCIYKEDAIELRRRYTKAGWKKVTFFLLAPTIYIKLEGKRAKKRRTKDLFPDLGDAM